jgi:RNA recognition motif-containing protein
LHIGLVVVVVVVVVVVFLSHVVDYFRNWGATNAYIVTNSTTGKSRNFGFLTFESEILGYKVLETVHLLKGRTVWLQGGRAGKERIFFLLPISPSSFLLFEFEVSFLLC